MAKNNSTNLKSYSKPPIIEAIIELRFADGLTDKQLNAVLQKKQNDFSIQKVEGFQFKINQGDTGASAETNQEFLGYKLTQKKDSSYIVQLKHDSMSLSRLPPYEGWPAIHAEFKRQYQWYIAKKFKTITRIGVRYINRIDIPTPNDRVDLDEYFNVSIKIPEKTIPMLDQFVVQAVARVDDTKALNVQLFSTETPLLNHSSFLFDLDVYQSTDLPKNDKDLDAAFDEIRLLKDKFFEELLTSKCKRLFK
jgi:uncharacterized protein (TIGR04255 family)